MKVKYFRLNVVFESSVTVLWALVYVPDGLPIGKLNVAGSLADSIPGALRAPAVHHNERCLHEPGQQRSVRALASLDAPSQESQSGRRGVLVWQALTSASSIPTVITLNYSSCVN